MSKTELFEGICSACGQVQTVEATSQEEANRIAILQCSCIEGALKRRKIRLAENLEKVCGANNPYGFEPVPDQALHEISILSEYVLHDIIKSAAFDIGKTRLKISINSKGEVKVSRTAKKAIDVSC